MLLISSGSTNQFVDVTFNPVTKTVTCFFLNLEEGTKKFCSIVYSVFSERLRCRKLQQNSTSLTDEVVMSLVPAHDQNDAPIEYYCFTVTASNGTFTAVVEGSFSNTSVTGK